MPNLRWLLVLAMLAVGIMPALAQTNDVPVLGLMQTVRGMIDDDHPEARWQFEASEGDTVSLVVQALSGDLDPVVQVFDNAGRMLGESDDIAYPEQVDAALEALAIPEGGIYTIRVSRYEDEEGATAGAYALSLVSGFAQPLMLDTFDGRWEWAIGPEEVAGLALDDGALTLTMSADNALGWANPQDAPTVPLQAYVQVEAEVTNAPDYWEYGLIFRQMSAASYYAFSVSSRGDWAFLARTGSSTWLRLQDWAEHPALAELEGTATLGVLMDGDTFTFFVNGIALDTITDDTLGTPGAVGLSAGTVDQQETFPTVVFDNFLVTQPLPPASTESGEPVGQTLQGWNALDSRPVVEELAGLGLIPEGGSQVMLVPDSYTTITRPGIQVLPLGQGRTQADFVMSTTVTMESESAENACGLLFRETEEAQYSLMYLDGLGGLGIAERYGETFEPAYYALDTPEFEAVNQVRIILVAVEDTVRVYLNGQLAAVRPNPAYSGRVGIAALSYDGQLVSCQYDNTWLWTWN